MRRTLRWAFGLATVFYAPLIIAWLALPIVPADQAQQADVALIFGALVRDGEISALHQERLDTATVLWRRGAAEQLVASNAPRAARMMQEYLVQAGVAPAAIVLDPEAYSTPDTCVSEAKAGTRARILISHEYHLPRIALHCWKLGVTGQYVAADRTRLATPPAGVATKVRVRAYRYTREAALLWAELLGLYRSLEQRFSP